MRRRSTSSSSLRVAAIAGLSSSMSDSAASLSNLRCWSICAARSRSTFASWRWLRLSSFTTVGAGCGATGLHPGILA